MFEMFPNLEFDSYLTLGAEFAGDEHPQTIWGDIDASAQFDGDASGYNVTVNDETGGAWYLPFPGLEEADTKAAVPLRSFLQPLSLEVRFVNEMVWQRRGTKR